MPRSLPFQHQRGFFVSAGRGTGLKVYCKFSVYLTLTFGNNVCALPLMNSSGVELGRAVFRLTFVFLCKWLMRTAAVAKCKDDVSKYLNKTRFVLLYVIHRVISWCVGTYLNF